MHLAGSSWDMAAIGALAERYDFAFLEDASHAMAAATKASRWVTASIEL